VQHLRPTEALIGSTRCRPYGGVSVELRPQIQRETVPIGLVELSP
jgi:hypothetical protein